MKAAAALLGLLAAALGGLTVLVAVIATHPWLATSYLTGPIVQTSRVASPGMVVLGSAPPGVPADQWALMVQAAQSSECGVSPSDLAAIATTESGFGSNVGPNPRSGAYGYGQFMPGSFAAEGGVGDPAQPTDALPVMAKMLCEKGYAANRTRALDSYGGCVSADCMPGGGDYASVIDQLAATFVPPAVSAAANDILGLAAQWVAANVPYKWGGNTMQGVDCSGLVQQIFAAIGIPLPRTAALQYAATTPVSPDQVQNGDLIFFHDTDPSDPGVDHVGIVTDAANGIMTHAPQPGEDAQTTSYRSSFYQAHLQGFARAA
jgi:hypothetical protein